MNADRIMGKSIVSDDEVFETSVLVDSKEDHPM